MEQTLRFLWLSEESGPGRFWWKSFRVNRRSRDHAEHEWSGGEFYEKYFLFLMYSILGRFDNNIITAANTSEMIVIFGENPFDNNPYIGTIADINVWSR